MERAAEGGVTGPADRPHYGCQHHDEIAFDVVVAPELDEAYPRKTWKKWLDRTHDRLKGGEYHDFLYHGETLTPQLFTYPDGEREVRVSVVKMGHGQFVMVLGFGHEVDLTMAEYAEAVLARMHYKNPRQRAEDRKKKRKADKRKSRKG
jgi:hypothetical protein